MKHIKMDNKQTAVEWLYELSKKRELDKFDYERAKSMEKEQIQSIIDETLLAYRVYLRSKINDFNRIK